MSTQFGKIEFWEKRYILQFQNNSKYNFEWYQEYEKVKDVITQYVQKNQQILNIGCGNSQLTAKMFKEGYYRITNIDWSETLIKQMNQRYDGWGTHFEFLQMDARQLEYDGEIDCIIDKGCLDSVLCGEYSNVHIHQLLDSIYKSLSQKGVYICITYGYPAIRENYLKTNYLWTVGHYKVYKPNVQNDSPIDETDENNYHYIYVCRKGTLQQRSQLIQQ